MKTQQTLTDSGRNTQNCCRENEKWARTRDFNRAWTRWTFFFIALLSTGLFVLGIVFDPSVTRILWLALTGILLGVVLPAYLYAAKRIRQCGEECEEMNEHKNENNE